MSWGGFCNTLWAAADGTAKAAAAAVATGAQIIGEVPVAIAHMENFIVDKSEQLKDSVETFASKTESALNVDATEWKAWMDKKVSRIESAFGKSVNLAQVDQDANSAVHRAQEQRREFLRTLEKVQKQHDDRIAQQDKARLAAAEESRKHIVAAGASIGQQVREDIDKAALNIVAGMVAVPMKVVATVKAPFIMAKGFFTCGKFGDPEIVCPDQSPAGQLYYEIIRAKHALREAKEQGRSPKETLKLQKSIKNSELALLSEDAYKADNDPHVLPLGWQRVDPKEVGLSPSDFSSSSGFHAVLYSSGTKPPEYVVSFEGTDPTSFANLKNDFYQNYGIRTDYYERAKALASKLQCSKEINSGKSLTFTGHSLGGGLATEAALYINAPAVVFNPSALSQQTLAYNSNHAQNLITNVRVDGELLSTLEKAGTMPPAPGKQDIIADPNTSDGLFGRHEMGSMMNSLTAELSTEQNQLVPLSTSAASGM